MSLTTKAIDASQEGRVAALATKHVKEVATLVDEADLRGAVSALPSSSSSAPLVPLALPAPSLLGNGGGSRGASGKAKVEPKTMPQPEPSTVPGLSRALAKARNDPITAACHARKVTLRALGEMRSKLGAADRACDGAKALIQDDFDCEE